jgi:hypothetical protein
MHLRSDSAAGVRFLAGMREGRGLTPSARAAGVGKTTGYRWLREAFLALGEDGCSVEDAQAELGYYSRPVRRVRLVGDVGQGRRRTGGGSFVPPRVAAGASYDTVACHIACRGVVAPGLQVQDAVAGGGGDAGLDCLLGAAVVFGPVAQIAYSA